MEALIHVAKTKLHPEQKKQMKTILLVILAMGRNCILEAPEPEPAEVIFNTLCFHEFLVLRALYCTEYPEPEPLEVIFGAKFKSSENRNSNFP